MQRLFLLLLLTQVCQSQTVVNSATDRVPGSYRNALAAVPDNGTITFDPSLDGQTITLYGIVYTDGTPPSGGPPAISKSITIDASALPNGITIDGSSSIRALEVAGSHTITIRNVRFTNCVGTSTSSGNTRGGAIVLRSGGALNLTNCEFVDCETSAGGGAVFVESATLNANGCTFADNFANFDGGAIHNNNGSTTLINCTFHDNEANANGGAVNIGSTTSLSEVIHCTFTSNLGGTGNAIRIVSGATTPNINASLFAEPHAGTTISGTFNSTETLMLTSAQIDALLPLGYYGGTTQTRPPQFGSLAVDEIAGTYQATDQRGIARDSTPDHGAAEGNRNYLVSSHLDDAGLTGTLRDGLSLQEANGTISLDSSLSGQTIFLAESNGSLETSAPLTLDASDLTDPLILDGTFTSSSTILVANEALTMDSFVLQNGYIGLSKAQDKPLTLKNCLVVGNNNCGLLLHSGETLIEDCSIRDNTSTGIQIENNNPSTATVTILTSAIRGNDSGIYNDDHKLVVKNSEITENSLSSQFADGAGIYTTGETLLENVTIANNVSQSDGGGIYKDDGGDAAPLTLIHCTITANSGSGISRPSSDVGDILIRHCAIVGNSDFTESRTDLDIISANGISFDGPSIIGFAPLSIGTGQLLLLSSKNFVRYTASGFAPLGDYGGPTRTCPPIPHAPAVNAGRLGLPTVGSSTLTDQRGLPRHNPSNSTLSPTGEVDLGAVELQPDGLFPVDLDGDGLSTMLELALGTNPLGDEPVAQNLALPTALSDPATRGIRFGVSESYDADVAEGFSIDVERSFDLQTFDKIFSYLPATGETIEGETISHLLEPTSLSVMDSTTAPKAFYRVRPSIRQWQTSLVAPTSVTDSTDIINTDIDATSTGDLGLVYYDQSTSNIVYSTLDGTGWNLQTINTSLYDGTSALSFSYSPTDQATIAFRGDVGGGTMLRVAQLNGATWNISDVSAASSEAFSLAFTPTGQPAVSYTNGSRLFYATYNGTSWTSQAADDPADPGNVVDSSLAFSSSGHPSIVYEDRQLRLTEFDGTNWQVSTVDSSATNTIKNIRHAYTPSGQAVALYITNNRAYYSRQLAGGLWERLGAPSGGSRDISTDLAFDSAGSPVLSSHNRYFTRIDLNLATFNGTEFSEETISHQFIGGVSSSGLYTDGLENSIIMMPDGTPIVAHYGDGYIKVTRLRQD
ncbi:MAG: choice-of-anchor Q domain-containing protein [Roseibacillus sp.]